MVLGFHEDTLPKNKGQAEMFQLQSPWPPHRV